MLRSGLALLAAVVGSASHAETGELFAVGDLSYDLRADDVVGRKRSGMLCTPAGPLRWRDVSPDRRPLVERIARRARDAGLAIHVPNPDDFDGEVRTRYRITVTVTQAAASACVPWNGIRIGKQPQLRGEREVRTIWRVFDQRTRALIAKVPLCRSGKYSADSADLSEPIASAVEDLSTAFAARLDIDRLIAGEPIPLGADQPCIEIRG